MIIPSPAAAYNSVYSESYLAKKAADGGGFFWAQNILLFKFKQEYMMGSKKNRLGAPQPTHRRVGAGAELHPEQTAEGLCDDYSGVLYLVKVTFYQN